MEDVKILKWLKDNSSGSGYGDGSGSGSGYGDGSGSGSGYGSGSGSGYGSGYGSGSGYGDGSGSGSGYGSGSGSGYGDGSGSGSGYGSGYGDGSGSGSGYGSGSGSGYGSGYGSGSGYGDGIKQINGNTVYMVDGVATIITQIALSLAKGFILQGDLTLKPCYIVKGNGYFAHGETREEAQEVLREKIFENMDTDEAIAKFVETFKKGVKYSGKDFFEWHHYLTGSCKMGRESFVRDRGLDLTDTYTVNEFITICENAYGGNVIKQLKERYS